MSEKENITDTRSRKWQITIENPHKYDMEHESIHKILKRFKSLVYACFCDETGEKGTYHTHIYMYCSSVVRFSKIKKEFPKAHIECANGTSQQNKDYIRKEGKWEKDKKKETNHIETYEEIGEMPVERQGKRNDLDALYDMINSGMSNADIIANDSSYILLIDKIDRARQAIRAEKGKKIFRKLNVHYIFGPTGTGKTRNVMEIHGYENVCKITNYDRHPFDSYDGQSVLLFDEFRSSLKIGDMLQYLDGYPVNLPARYGDKVALFTEVYILSNIHLKEQYLNVQQNELQTWNAFCRRITDCTYLNKEGSITFPVGSSSVYFPSVVELESDIEKNNKKINYTKKTILSEINEIGNIEDFISILEIS